MQLLHVTTRSAAESILRTGFEPRIGPRSTALGESEPAIYFFNNDRDLTVAADNWLSEAFEDVEEALMVVVTAVPSDRVHIDPTAAFEARVLEPIPPAAVVRVYDIDTGEVIFPGACALCAAKSSARASRPRL